MPGMRFIAAAGLAMATHVYGADEQARAAFEQAFDRQHALPGYVEHQFSRFPLRTGGAGGTTSTGSERETLTIEHMGDRQRQLIAGVGEIVWANGRVARRFNLSPQVAQIRAAATTTPLEGLRTVAGVAGSLKDIYDYLSQGPVGVFLGAMTAVDQATQMLSSGAGKADLSRAADMLEQQTLWRCEPDDPPSHHPGKVISTHQLADESISGVPTHVYSETRVFEFIAAPLTNGTEDTGDTSLRGYSMQSRAWVRTADGLPLRSELVFPGGRLRTEYEYPAAVEFAVPECATRP